ncbi:MAG: replicative DNA helicase [Clostridia bacterium]|nr:replicative DNA helicase [Clostridia bacterium]
MDEENSLSLAELNAQSVAERDLPFNMEAEQAVLGSMLTDQSSVSDAAELLLPEDFYFSANRFIYDAILDLFNDNKAIDFVTVSEQLKISGRLDAVGGIDYLKRISMSVPTTQHVRYYSKIIKEKSILRKLIKSAGEISEMAYSEDDSLARMLERSEQIIFDISASREQSDIVHIGDILQASYELIAKNAEAGTGLTGLDTGFGELNKNTGGFHAGELIIIAGRPGMGKSTFAVNIAEHISIGMDKPVAIFNLEMPKEQVVNRIICSQALIDNSNIQTGNMQKDDWTKIIEVADDIAKAPLYIDDTPTITVSQIRAKCRRLKQTSGLSAVVIDYLQLMQGSGRSENRQQEIAEISRSLKVLAKELDIPVIALSQLRRESERQKGGRPALSDLRESGAIEQDADLVMFLFRNYYYSKDPEEKYLAECIIAKNRNGATTDFKLGFRGEYSKFQNLEYREE